MIHLRTYAKFQKISEDVLSYTKPSTERGKAKFETRVGEKIIITWLYF